MLHSSEISELFNADRHTGRLVAVPASVWMLSADCGLSQPDTAVDREPDGNSAGEDFTWTLAHIHTSNLDTRSRGKPVFAWHLDKSQVGASQVSNKQI